MAVEAARSSWRSLINADLREIVWTSGATEADNLAIKGVVAAARRAAAEAPHVVTSADRAQGGARQLAALEADGVSRDLPGARCRRAHCAGAVRAALRPETCLVSIMHANNEIGTVNDIAAIAACAAGPACCTWTPRRAWARSRWMSGARCGPACPCPRTSSTDPRASVRCTCAAVPRPPLAAQMHGGGHERGCARARCRRTRSSAWVWRRNSPASASRKSDGAWRAARGSVGSCRGSTASRSTAIPRSACPER
jgi:cysteine desulfurase